MTAIVRRPDRAARQSFDVIVIGGGVQGACLALEASRRGLRVLLLERGDFGGETSWNSLRIVHGGLRHLQRLDLRKFLRSTLEQAWWLRTFPDLVEPLPCILPLYNRGIRTLPVLDLALRTQRGLCSLLHGLRPGDFLGLEMKPGRIVSPAETETLFPAVERQGLRGAALWFDGLLTDPQRLQMEILRWAAANDAQILNYLECDDVIADAGRVVGVAAHCRETGRRFQFSGGVVVNTAGSRAVGQIGLDKGPPGTSGSAVAFNLVLGRSPLSRHAVAISTGRRGAPTYFAVPYGDRTMVGTVHLSLAERAVSGPSWSQVSGFLYELNAALSTLRLSMDDVREVHAGRLPASATGSSRPATEARLTDHSDHGGPVGFLSVESVKYTASRWVAEQTVNHLARRYSKRPLAGYRAVERPKSVAPKHLLDAARPGCARGAAEEMAKWMNAESVVHIDDLLLRRCDSDRDPGRLASRANHLMGVLNWSPPRRGAELQRLVDALRSIGPPKPMASTFESDTTRLSS